MTNKQRVFQALLFGWMLVTIFSLYAGFMPTNAWGDWSYRLALPFGILFAITWCFTYPRIFQGSLLRKSATLLVLLLFSGAFGFFGLKGGMPWLWTRAVGEDINASAVVLAKGDGNFRWRDYCESHHIQLNMPKESKVARMCLDENGWTRYQIGDQVQIGLRHSSLGSYVNSIATKP